MSYSVQVYTKEAFPDTYPDGLARSVHFALLGEDGSRTELNRGYGMLFARGEISPEGTIVPKALRDPEISRLPDGSFLIRAVRTEEDGTEESCGAAGPGVPGADPAPGADSGTAEARPVSRNTLCWTSIDLIHFTEVHSAGRTEAEYLPAALTDEEAARILAFWNAEPGKPLTAFPWASGLADPVFFRHGGKWYFIFTNDNVNDIGIYIREADTIPELLRDDTPIHLILAPNKEKGLIQTFWAPEIHEIGGELWILFAVSAEEFGPCCHMMKLKPGGRLTGPDSYEEPVPVRRRDGSVLTVPEYRLRTPAERMEDRPVTAEDGPIDDRIGISLDMTYLEDAGRAYVLWSYRKGIAGSAGLGGPKDSGSMILIAEIRKEQPWQLISDPVLISRPLYGYENARGTVNNEGPYVYKRDGVIHVNYSGGDARGYLYVVNLLSAKAGSDLLDPASWKKRNTPLLNFTTYPGVYGPGHNSYFTDEDGRDWIAFHAVDSMDGKRVSVGIYEYPTNMLMK
ncbi:MAG: family 43 glycosylhydrolase [Lachnospiraceae bacterium]|nr:family 43 glycosylhydrolase [Lachnospiraceae bacterium]